MAISNPKLQNYKFLPEMYASGFFPDFLVDQGKDILVELCEQIESQNPTDDSAVYLLTHAATEKFNDLQQAFYDNDSEIETAARDCISTDFEFIAKAYGFDLDTEELIAPREW